MSQLYVDLQLGNRNIFLATVNRPIWHVSLLSYSFCVSYSFSQIFERKLAKWSLQPSPNLSTRLQKSVTSQQTFMRFRYWGILWNTHMLSVISSGWHLTRRSWRVSHHWPTLTGWTFADGAVVTNITWREKIKSTFSEHLTAFEVVKGRGCFALCRCCNFLL
jgi:hypothetical protein